jgi:holo-[acyl-carrier protein] synthase
VIISKTVIIGTGVDIVFITRFEKAIERWGDRFSGKILSKEESRYCFRKANPAPHFAVRWAAKEAFFKAIGDYKGRGIRWREVAVVRDAHGKPSLELRGGAQKTAEERGVRKIWLSMSHDTDWGMAQVILES